MGDLSGRYKNSKNLKIIPIIMIFHIMSYFDFLIFLKLFNFFFLQFLNFLNFLRILWRTRQVDFCGAPGQVRHRMSISVAHAHGAPQKKKFSGEDSVAHAAILGVRHRILIWCATDSCFPSSARP